MNYKYDANWDKKVNDLLDRNEIKLDDFGGRTALIGDCSIWLGNYPYAYGTNWDASISVRPSRYTIWRIRQRVKYDKLSKEEKRDLKINQIIS
jgi:hypothetical protein